MDTNEQTPAREAPPNRKNRDAAWWGNAYGKRWDEVKAGDTISGGFTVTAIRPLGDECNLRVTLDNGKQIIVWATSVVR